MPVALVNGVRLFTESRGDSGPTLVLVHGSWGDHHNWDAVVPGFARTHRILTYDRRGHSRSQRLDGQGSIDEDVADLAALIADAGHAPVHVAGNSFGASIALKLAAAHPDLLASVIAHEPPLIGLIGNHPALPAVQQRVGAVVQTLDAGDIEAGARQFVETVALGPGMWDRLPLEMRRTFVVNAPTWVDEMNEPGAFTIDLQQLGAFPRPVLLSEGDQSPPFFGAILGILTPVLPQRRRHVFAGAGHVPHLTHADAYVDVVSRFVSSVAAARA